MNNSSDTGAAKRAGLVPGVIANDNEIDLNEDLTVNVGDEIIVLFWKNAPEREFRGPTSFAIIRAPAPDRLAATIIRYENLGWEVTPFRLRWDGNTSSVPFRILTQMRRESGEARANAFAKSGFVLEDDPLRLYVEAYLAQCRRNRRRIVEVYADPFPSPRNITS